MYVCYTKKLLDLFQSVYPMDTPSSIDAIVKKIKKAGGGSADRMKAAFKQDLPIEMKTATYNDAQRLVSDVTEKAKLEREPKIFRQIAHPKQEKVPVYNQAAGYDARLFEIPAKKPSSDILKLLSLAADILEKANGKDVYLDVAKDILQEAREKMGGAENE